MSANLNDYCRVINPNPTPFSWMWDGITYTVQPQKAKKGQELVLPGEVARHLQSHSYVPHLKPLILEPVELGAKADAAPAQTQICPFCGFTTNDFAEYAAHITEAHAPRIPDAKPADSEPAEKAK